MNSSTYKILPKWVLEGKWSELKRMHVKGTSEKCHGTAIQGPLIHRWKLSCRDLMSFKGIDRCTGLKLAGQIENYYLQPYMVNSFCLLQCKVRHLILKSVWVHFDSADSSEGSSKQVGTDSNGTGGTVCYLSMSPPNGELCLDFQFLITYI